MRTKSHAKTTWWKFVLLTIVTFAVLAPCQTRATISAGSGSSSSAGPGSGTGNPCPGVPTVSDYMSCATGCTNTMNTEDTDCQNIQDLGQTNALSCYERAESDFTSCLMWCATDYGPPDSNLGSGSSSGGGSGGSGCTCCGVAYPYQFVGMSYLATNLPGTSTYSTSGSSILTTDPAGDIQPVHLLVGGWSGSNVTATTKATGVSFYAVSLSVVAQYVASTNLANLPWTYVGSGTQNSNTGFWEMDWTPATNETYFVDADIYDPTLTNAYTNNLGFVTNGISSALNLVIPAPPIPQIVTPVALANGSCTFQVVGPPASYCTVQESSDLKIWRNALVLSNFTGQLRFVDDSGVTNHNFYRAILEEGSAGAGTSVVYQGLINTGQGQASLYVTNLGSGGQDGSALYVTNLGSSGQDGVALTLPADTSSLVVNYQALDPANTLPAGAYLQEQLVGPGNESFGTASLTKQCAVCNGTNWAMAVNFSAVGTTGYVLQAYLQGNLVGQFTNIDGPVGWTTNAPSGTDTSYWEMPTIYSPCGITGYPPCYTWVPSYSFLWTSGTTMILTNAGTTFNWAVDHIVVTAYNQTVAIETPPSALQITAAQMASFAITTEDQSVVYQGLTNAALGRASLSVTNLGSGGQDGSALYVTNLGSSGQDGVTVSLPANPTAFTVAWQPLDVSNTLPVGAYLQGQVVGTAGSVTNGVIGSLTVTKAGVTNYAVTANSPVSTTNTFTVVVYSGSTPVAQVGSISGTLCYASQMLHDEDDNGHWTWPSNTTFTFNGGPVVQGDTLAVVPTKPPSITAIYSAQLFASGIPQIVITNETAAGSFTQLQVLLPGETNAPYTTTGKTGTPTQTSLNFNPYSVTVLAVDANWNPVSTGTGTISISSSDAGAILPTPQGLVNGTLTFGSSNPFYFGDAGTWTITAADESNTSIPPATSSQVVVVQ